MSASKYLRPDSGWQTIGEMGFAGIGFVKIIATADLSTAKALEMAGQIVEMMKIEVPAAAP
jgi:hypothetical protein